MPESKLRIFLADDHAVVRDGLRSLIDAQLDMEVVGVAGDGRSALEGAAQLRPDVVVMDVSMPGMDGAQATAQLRKDCPEVLVLVLTAHEYRSYLRQLFDAGATGYVLKRAAADELIHAIRTVAAGGIYIDPALAGEVVAGFVKGPSGNARTVGELSERERDVLRLIARGFSNKEIAARLEISVKTVETYKARSMEKLGLTSRTEIIKYALQRGWLSDE